MHQPFMVPPYEERLNRVRTRFNHEFSWKEKAERNSRRLDGVSSLFAGTDTYHFLDGGHKNLSIADLTAMCGMLNSVHGAVEKRVLDHDLDLHLRQEIDDIFRAPVELGMALLPAVALGLGHGQ